MRMPAACPRSRTRSTGVPSFFARATPLSSGPHSINGTPSSCMEWRSSNRSARSTKGFTTCARLVSSVVGGWSSRPQRRRSGKANSIGGFSDMDTQPPDGAYSAIPRSSEARPSGLPVPAREIPGVVVPAGELADELVVHRRDTEAGDDGDHHVVVDGEVVQLDQHGSTLDGIELDLGGLVDVVVFLVLPAGDVAALPLVRLARHFPGAELAQEHLWVGRCWAVVVHLQVGIEVRIGVGVGDIRREEHRRRHRLDLDVDASLLAGLLDDRLVLLARLVDRGLIDELQLLAILGADAVGAFRPAGLVQDVVGLVDVELVLGVLGAETLRVVDEVRRRHAGAAIDELLDRVLVDQDRQRLAHRGIAEGRMLSLEARPLAVDLGPWVGGVELDVLDAAALAEEDAALAALLEAQEDFVLDLHVPAEVELAGLQDRARRRHRIAAALHFDGVEIGPVLAMVVGVDDAGHQVARLEVLELVRPGAD